VPRNGDARQPDFSSETVVAGIIGAATTTGSVNSRTACSRLALQTRDLHAQKVSLQGIWGDFGGSA
jgi:hypothetical protein